MDKLAWEIRSDQSAIEVVEQGLSATRLDTVFCRRYVILDPMFIMYNVKGNRAGRSCVRARKCKKGPGRGSINQLT